MILYGGVHLKMITDYFLYLLQVMKLAILYPEFCKLPSYSPWTKWLVILIEQVGFLFVGFCCILDYLGCSNKHYSNHTGVILFV